ncbi:MAG: BglG family transcription antiterminator [Bacillota bacterium]
MRYDLNAVADWAAHCGGRLVRQPGRGVSLEGLSLETLSEAGIRIVAGRPQSQYEYVCTPSERRHAILLQLLDSAQGVRIQDLAAALFVSRATIHKDLDELAERLQSRGLSLIRRPYTGICLDGPEEAWRRAAVDVLLEMLTPASLAQVLEGKQRLPWAEDLEEDLTAVGRAARRAGEILKFRLADDAFLQMVVHLTVAVRRLRAGGTLPPNPDAPALSRQESALAETVAAEVGVATGVQLPAQDLQALIRYLSGAPLWMDNAVPTAVAEGSQELRLAKDLLRHAGALLGVPLSGNRELAMALALHLKPLGTRLRQSKPADNPLLDDIRDKMPAVWQVTQKSVHLLEKQWGVKIPPAEVGFIAVHLGAALEGMRAEASLRPRALVVCGQGLGTARLLAARLKTEFPELDIGGVSSVFDADAKLAKEPCNLVISTVPIPGLEVPVVQIGPLLSPEDRRRVRQALQAYHERTQREGCQPVLTDLLTPERIALGIRAANWEEAVRAAGGLLVQSGAAEPRYVEAMARNVRQIGPYIVIAPGVAMPHARPEDGARQVAISLARLATPVRFGHDANDPVDLVFALAAVDSDTHLTAITQLAEFLSESDGAAKLRAAGTPQELLDSLSHAIHSMQGR